MDALRNFMALTACPECGNPLKGNEQTCPECGNLIPKEEAELHYYDDIDYSNYHSDFIGGFNLLYFEAEYEDEKDSYDSWNDFCLFWNLLWRIILFTLLPIFIIAILVVLFIFTDLKYSLGLKGAMPILCVIGGILVIISPFVFFRIAMRKYWLPLHRTWRRINKRYWINMYKGVKHNNVDIL